MPYIIDGHNLIPKISGLSLQAVDDEMQLVELLLEFCRLRRKQAAVFFDNAPPGDSRVRNFGKVVAHFVPQGQTADQAIGRRLGRLGGEARNWTVVSSDQAVQAAARARRAQVLPSESFAAELMSAIGPRHADKTTDVSISADELDAWLDLFGVDEEEG